MMYDQLFQYLQDFNKWEMKWVTCDEAWDTKSGLPKLTRELYDEYVVLQDRRAELVKSLVEFSPAAKAWHDEREKRKADFLAQLQKDDAEGFIRFFGVSKEEKPNG